MLGVVFLFSHFSPIKIIVFNSNFLYRFKISTSWFQISKDVSPPIVFVNSGGLKMPNWQRSGLNYARFEEFIHNVESVTRTIYAWKIILQNTIVPNYIEETNRSYEFCTTQIFTL